MLQGYHLFYSPLTFGHLQFSGLRIYALVELDTLIFNIMQL